MPRRMPIAALCVTLACLPAAAAEENGQLRAQDAAAALLKGNTGMAVTLYTEALRDPALSNDRRAIIFNDRGVAQSRLGQVKLAIEDFNGAVQLFPEYAPTYNNRGSLLVSVGLVKEAAKDFDRAIALSPGYAAAYNNRAAARLQLGLPQESIADYSKAISLLPQSPAPLAGRGRAYMAMNRPHAAIRDFSRAVNADQKFAAGYRSRAEAKILTERYDEAIEDFSRAIAFDSGNIEVYVLRGQAYLSARNVASALKDFSRAIEIDGRSVTAYQARALAYGTADAIDDALADIGRAIEIDPRNAVSFAYRGWIYKQSRQAELGYKDVQTAIRLDPDRAEVMWAKGELEAALGRPEQAIVDLRRALELRPGLKLAADGLERLGAKVSAAAEKEVPGLGVERWRVFARGDRLYAVHDDYKRLQVPLEIEGTGQPRLLEWEIKKPPLKGIGVLRFHGGTVQGAAGPEEIEQIAILDLFANSVIAIEPHRRGNKVASWTWDEGKVVVASIDGVADEFQLRATKPKEQPVAKAPDKEQRRVTSSEWAPWQPSGSGGGGRRSSQPKTLFQLLFGN